MFSHYCFRSMPSCSTTGEKFVLRPWAAYLVVLALKVLSWLAQSGIFRRHKAPDPSGTESLSSLCPGQLTSGFKSDSVRFTQSS